MQLSKEHVLSLALDESSQKAGKGLTEESKWITRGFNDVAIWGECKGSGNKSYQTQVDLGNIAFKCSCPSRKFPCKHGLGLRKWRMILGGHHHDGTGFELPVQDPAIDKTLEALYDSDRQGGPGASSPNVARWLGDIRSFFPNTVVQVMQQDALKRLNLTQMLLEKEKLQNANPMCIS